MLKQLRERAAVCLHAHFVIALLRGMYQLVAGSGF
jgi:hypothetical protein